MQKQNTGENRKIKIQTVIVQMQATLLFQVLTSEFGSLTQGERHNSYNANHLQCVAVEICKTQLHLQRPKSNSMPQWQTLNSLSPWSNLNSQLTLFQNPQILRTISSLQPYFLSGGLLWQWWLSYLLHTSVNCTNWLYTWTLNQNSSKPNQTEW